MRGLHSQPDRPAQGQAEDAASRIGIGENATMSLLMRTKSAIRFSIGNAGSYCQWVYCANEDNRQSGKLTIRDEMVAERKTQLPDTR